MNLAYRWFCRLDLNDRIPDHSTFSKNRHGRFRDSELLRHPFETTVARCIAEGLVSGQRMAVDASLIEADANRQFSASKEEWDINRIDVAAAPRAVREYLDTLDEAAFGAASEVQPKFTSFSDPASQWTAARKGPAFFSYSDNYLIDTDHGVVVDVEATRSIRQAEVGSTKTMLDRDKDKFDLDPERLIADTAYGSGQIPTDGFSQKLEGNRVSGHCERRWKCSSRTSSAYSGSGGYDYVAHAAQMTNSSSPPPPRTSANWRRSFLRRSNRAKPDQKGARAPFSCPLSALATRCFSTEWAGGRSRYRGNGACG